MTVKEQAELEPLTLPDLPYDYDDLEPVISGEIMSLHHTKHHAGYVKNFNTALEKTKEAASRQDLAGVIAWFNALQFNGGGHINHALFWQNLAPQREGGGQSPTGPLWEAIQSQWGSLENFITAFNSQVGPLQGSGWGWLGYGKQKKELVIATCANQNPLSMQGYVPLLGVDVWEHAYYLQYKNARPDYLKAIWGVINWKTVAERYAQATH